MDLSALTLLAAVAGLAVGGLALYLGRNAPKAVTKLRGEYNADLKRLGDLEIEVTHLQIENIQMRSEIESQHEMLTRQHRDAMLRDTHLNELYTRLTILPPEWQAATVGGMITPRPPPLLHAPPAVRHISAGAIRALVGILAPLPWLSSRDRRDAVLLAGLAPKFVSKIPRSDTTQVDLINIFTTAFGFGPEMFRTVLQNAEVDLEGSMPGNALKSWCTEWGFDPIVPHTP